MLYTSATLILILILIWLLLRQVQQLNHSRLRIEASEERYRLLFSGAEDAILLINQDHRYVDCNPAAVRLFGVSSVADIVGHKAGEFSSILQAMPGTPQTDGDTLIDQFIERAFDGIPQRFESIMEREGIPCTTR
jgi:PAS domain-containing protein